MDDFILEYNKFDDKEKTMFAKAINKLINEKYITASKIEDDKYYHYIRAHLKIINEYLIIMNMEVKHNPSIKVLELIEEHQSRILLSRLNSIILLILRLLYNQKLREITTSSSIIVTSKEIRDMYDNFNFEKKLDSTNFLTGLKVFKKYNIIDYTGTDVKKDTFQITIYPTIISVLNINDIENIYNKINSYKEVKDEEAYEDQTD